MGDKAYAHAMASLLDTSGTLFKNRIVANSDVTHHGHKDLDVVMLRGAERLVVILDDTEPVWAANRANLVQVRVEPFGTTPPTVSFALCELGTTWQWRVR